MVEKSSGVQKYILFLLLFLIIVLISFNFILDREDLKEKITGVFEPKPGSCLILEEKYCKEVKIIPHPTKENVFLAVANLPLGTPIFSPIDGNFSVTTNTFKNDDGTLERYPGFMVLDSEDGTFTKAKGVHGFVLIGERPEDMKGDVKKGDMLCKIFDKKIDKIGDYNLVYNITKYEKGEEKINYVSDVETLRIMFGN